MFQSLGGKVKQPNIKRTEPFAGADESDLQEPITRTSKSLLQKLIVYDMHNTATLRADKNAEPSLKPDILLKKRVTMTSRLD